MTLEQLRALQATHHERMKAILALAKTEKRNLTTEEGTEFDELKGKIETIRGDIERMEESERIERELNEPQRKPLVGASAGQNASATVTAEEKERAAYETSFVHLLRGRATHEDYAHLNKRALNTGIDAEGGYLVPETWTNNILESLVEHSTIRDDISIIQTSSTLNIPLDGDEIEFQDLEELAEYPELQPNFGKKQLGAYKKGGIILISRELLNDSPFQVQAHIEKKMRRGIARGDDKSFIQGTGTNQPTGILAATTQEVASVATGITYKDLTAMKYAVDAEYRVGAKWRVSDAFLEAVENLVDADGRPIYTEGNISKDIPATLLGHTVVADNLLDNEIAAGKYPALFGNFKSYVGADRGDIYVQVLTEKYASKGAIGILVDKRTDGNLADTKAMAKLKIS